MAMDVGGGRGDALNSTINVTPLVDVMLVLLIIMMLVAPMLQQGVPVKLPLADNTQPKPDNQQQTVVTVDAWNNFHVNGVKVDKAELGNRVKTVLEEKTERVVLIKGDADASYSAVMTAMDDLRKVGVEDIGLITDPKTPVDRQQGGRP
jgi:biopolymer transport protein TolR